jgi:hypothetical protein
MSDLHDRVYAVINSNAMIYDSNEFEIQMYMKSKWRDAFVAAREAEGGEFDDAFPPPVPIVADLADDAVADHDKFISDFKGIIRYLSQGG